MDMIKKVKKIEKWLLLVLVSFCVIFTLNQCCDMGLASAIGCQMEIDKVMNMDEEFQAVVKEYDKNINNTFTNNNDEGIIDDLYKEYPVGTYAFLFDCGVYNTQSERIIISFIVGILIGTGIYLLIDEDKKGIKLLALVYVMCILLLGFLEGMYNSGNSLLDKWDFPVTYIIPGTIMFALVVVLLHIKQQNLARELNRKLEEEKKKLQDQNIETQEKEETFLERTRETREKMAKIGSVVIEIIMIIILYIYIICA